MSYNQKKKTYIWQAMNWIVNVCFLFFKKRSRSFLRGLIRLYYKCVWLSKVMRVLGWCRYGQSFLQRKMPAHINTTVRTHLEWPSAVLSVISIEASKCRGKLFINNCTHVNKVIRVDDFAVDEFGRGQRWYMHHCTVPFL